MRVRTKLANWINPPKVDPNPTWQSPPPQGPPSSWEAPPQQSPHGAGSGSSQRAYRPQQATPLPNHSPRVHDQQRQKSFGVTLMLAALFGFVGADRFYLGKYGTAVAKLLTFGGLGAWWAIDIILYAFGTQTDARGLPLEGYDKYRKMALLAVSALFSLVVASLLSSQIATTIRNPHAGNWIWLGILLALLAALIGYLVFNLRPLIEPVLERRRAARPEPVKVDPVPAPIMMSLSKLARLRGPYATHAAAGNADAIVIVEHLDRITATTPELFRLLHSKKMVQATKQATDAYSTPLKDLATALDEDNFLNALANPYLWVDANDQSTLALQAAMAIDASVLDSVRRVNAGLEPRFEL